MRRLVAVMAMALAAAVSPASAHPGGNQADLFSGNTLEGERYWTADSGCDPDYDGEHTQPWYWSGGGAGFLPHSGCGLNYSNVYVHGTGGCFSEFRVRFGGTSGYLAAEVRILVNGVVVAAGGAGGTGGQWVTWIFDSVRDWVAPKQSTIRVTYSVVGNTPSFVNMDFDWARFGPCGGGTHPGTSVPTDPCALLPVGCLRDEARAA